MVTHDAAAAATADSVLFLADGQIVDRHERPDAGRDPRPPEGARGVIGLALRGLATRKLRSALTAIAVLLGVAMIAGTYVLTDQIRGGFDDLQENVYAGRRRRADAQGGVRHPVRRRRGRSTARPGRPGPRGRRRRGGGGAARGARRRSWSTASSSESSGGPAGSDRHDRHARAVQLRRQRRRRAADRLRPGRGAARHRRASTTSRSATGSASRPARGTEHVTVVGDLRPGRRLVARRRRRRVGAAGRHPALVRPRGRGHLDRRRARDDGVAPEQLVQRIRAAVPATRRRGQDRLGERRARPPTEINDEIGGFLTPALLAFAGRVAARGRVHHLQHVLDHGRRAHARVRAAAHARRHAAPDPGSPWPAEALIIGSSRRCSACCWASAFARC